MGDFSTLAIKTDNTLWVWGRNSSGMLGLNQTGATYYSSPVQIPGTTWTSISEQNWDSWGAVKTDGTLYLWGNNSNGILGDNSTASKSSPIQVPGTTWSKTTGANTQRWAIKTDGTLWGWGRNEVGQLGQNSVIHRSSPVQVPGTTWKDIASTVTGAVTAVKTDGTMWSWGNSDFGSSGRNVTSNPNRVSSPVQIGSNNNWDLIAAGYGNFGAITSGDSD